MANISFNQNELIVCADCAMIIANDDDSGIPESDVETVRKAVGAHPTLVIGSSEWTEEEMDFDCELCNREVFSEQFYATPL